MNKKSLDIIDVFLTILVFSYIFMFSIYNMIDSSIVALIICCIIIMMDKNKISMLIKILFSKKVISIYKIYIISCLWIILIKLLNNTKDYLFLKTLFHGLIQIIIGFCVFIVIKGYNRENKIVNYLIVAFVLQTCIEWLALISPTFKAIIYATKDVETINIADQYGGIRGLSLSGSSFFGLAIAFGFCYIIFLSRYNTLFNQHKGLKIGLFLFLVSGTFFAGRTGLISAGLVIVFCLLKFFANGKINIKNLKELIGLVIIGIIGIVFVVKYTSYGVELTTKIGYLYNYVGEALINLFSGNGLTTTSTSELYNQMYFNIKPKTFIIGDGLYFVDGGYYMNTDAGFMRVILYAGILLMILLFLIQNKIMKLGENEKAITILIWIFSILCQTKGELIGFALLNINILVLYEMQTFLTGKSKINTINENL